MSYLSMVTYLLWHIWLYGGYMALVLAVVLHRRYRCIDQLWWWLLGALVQVSWAAHEAMAGHVGWASFEAACFIGCCVGAWRIVDAELARAGAHSASREWTP